MSKQDAVASNIIPFPSSRVRRPAPSQQNVVDWEAWYHLDELAKIPEK